VVCFAFKSNSQITISKQDASCGPNAADGSATVSVSGGTPPYTYQWSNGETTTSISGLTPGTYSVNVQDANGCSGSASVLIEGAGTLQLSISGTGNVTFCIQDGPPDITLTATASGGTPPYTYSWPNGQLSISSSGTYSCTANDSVGCQKTASIQVVFIPIRCSRDPNDITGPAGYGDEQWISKDDNIPYVIRFENDPEFATAPAQMVEVRHPFNVNVSKFTFRLTDFGFGDFVYLVPANKTFYSERIDVVDSLGVFVDIIAGIDVVNNEAFWIFQSIDPLTGLPPNDPFLGFLPVNDSITHRGEGYVSFKIEAANSVVTGDSICAYADIVFDINETITTNVWCNTVDAFPPSSTVDSIPSITSTTTFDLTISGQDDPGGCGISKYQLYFSRDDDPYALYGEYDPGIIVSFTGFENSTYGFFSIASDHVGNVEPMKSVADAVTTIASISIVLDLKVYLEGPFNGIDMSTSLLSNDLVPLSQPFNAYPWFYGGYEDITSLINDDIVDWLLVELRKAKYGPGKSESSKIIGQKAVLLTRSGKIIDDNGSNTIETSISEEIDKDLYIVIYHRNHIPIMSSNPVNETGGIYTYDFSTGADKVYGGTSGYKELATGIWGLVAADGNADGQVDIYDKLNIWAPQAGEAGYKSGDFDLDGQVANPDKNEKWVPNTGTGSQVPE